MAPPITQRSQRAADDTNELGRQQYIKDTRSTWTVLREWLADPSLLLPLFGCLALIPVVVPAASIPCVLVMAFFWLTTRGLFAQDRLPFRMPFYAAKQFKFDPGDPQPGSRRAQRPAGKMFVGNKAITGEELWTKFEDMLTHTLVFGSTGSGKTETLVGFAAHGLLHVSGFDYVDPKAAPKLAFQIFSMARMFLREHDVRVLNYMTGNEVLPRRHPKRMSNTTNPFFAGNPESASNTLTSLITVSKGDNAVFGQNAQNMMSALMRGLVERRDKMREPLDVRVIRQHLAAQKYIDLAADNRLSELTRESMKAFLASMGYVEGTPIAKQSSFNQQYGYSIAYYSQPLNSLTDSYGYIFGASKGEVDRIDAIRSRRIVVELLPSLEKSPAELSNLGKVSLSAIKLAVSSGLPARLEGEKGFVIDSAPLAGGAPYQVIVDEYAAIATEGFVQVLTQGRGIGIAALIGTQDAAGLRSASEVEANQSQENSKLKFFMNQDLAGETFEVLKKAAGDVAVSQSGGMEVNQQGMTGDYADTLRTNVQMVSRVQPRDLQEQIEGEFHAMFRGRLVRGISFYANPPLARNFQLRLNRMLALRNVQQEDVDGLSNATEDAVAILLEWAKSGPPAAAAWEAPRLNALAQNLAVAKAASISGRERIAGAFVTWMSQPSAAASGGTVTLRTQGEDGSSGIEERDDDVQLPPADAAPAADEADEDLLPPATFVPPTPRIEPEDDDDAEGGLLPPLPESAAPPREEASIPSAADQAPDLSGSEEHQETTDGEEGFSLDQSEEKPTDSGVPPGAPPGSDLFLQGDAEKLFQPDEDADELENPEQYPLRKLVPRVMDALGAGARDAGVPEAEVASGVAEVGEKLSSIAYPQEPVPPPLSADGKLTLQNRMRQRLLSNRRGGPGMS
jgi:intracellular multiplication protein IcmO